MMNEVRVVKASDKLFIYTPFELKDALKSAFPRAKWDAWRRAWSVSSSAQKRVDSFIAEIEKSGVVDALNEKEQAELDADDICRLENELASIIKQTRAALDDAATSAERIAKAEELRAHIVSETASLEAAKKAAAEKAAEEADAHKSLEDMLSGVVDFDAIRSDLSALYWVAGVPKSDARIERNEIRPRIVAQRKAANAVGVELDSVLELLEKNFNRISKHDVSEAKDNLLSLSVFQAEED